MPDEQQSQGGETQPTTPPAGQSQALPPETGKDGQPFDAARAMSTIDQLREEIKGLKGTKKERDDLATKLKEIEDAGKSETERAVSERDQTKAKLSETETRLRGMAIRVAVAESASAAGIAPENVRAAIRLIDANSLELDDDGEPKDIEAALKTLVKEFPMLAGSGESASTTKTATRSVPATPKPSGQQPTRDEQVAQARKELAGSGRYAPL